MHKDACFPHFGSDPLGRGVWIRDQEGAGGKEPTGPKLTHTGTFF